MAYCYIVPVIGTGQKNDPRRPKYIADTLANWAIVDGPTHMLVVVDGISQVDHDTLVAHSDAWAVDLQALDTALSGVMRNRVNTYLTQAGIAVSVSAGITCTALLRAIAEAFQSGLRERLIHLGTTTV